MWGAKHCCSHIQMLLPLWVQVHDSSSNDLQGLERRKGVFGEENDTEA